MRRNPLLAAAAALVLAISACTDDPTGERPAPPAPVLAAVSCQVTMPEGSMRCGAPVDGASLDLRTVGGQGIYVRVTSGTPSYEAPEFVFDVTVQNLSNLAMATSDGAARHAEGVRVFFHTGPTVTGGTGTVAVLNATGIGTFTGVGQPYFQYGGNVLGTDQGELGADGILSPGEPSAPATWRLTVPATVTTFAFTLYVSTHTPAGTLATQAPQVTSIEPATLVPGQIATLTGTGFHPTPASNAVTIGGQPVQVTGGTASTLTVVVPCIASGPVAVQVTQGGMRGAPTTHPLAVNTLTLAAGQAVVMTDPAQVACNELASAGGPADYLVAVYNTSTAPMSSSIVELGADGAVPAVPLPAPARVSAPGRMGLHEQLAAQRRAREDEMHLRILEMNRSENERLRALYAGDPRMRARGGPARVTEPPATLTIRVPNINSGSFCNNFIEVPATRVYYEGRLAIYQDNANPVTVAGSAALAAYMEQIGDQYNADMEPVITGNFGDPLVRDAVTDDNGVLIALFTNVINTSFPNVAGFVTSCDQYPRGAGNLSSNFGEVFYARVPTSTGSGFFTSGTVENWYFTIRSTFIHETKHVASQAARVVNGAPFEESWLEEGSARHSEELWARSAVYGVPWKGNTGYGSAGAPGSLYCDVRPTVGACTAGNARRPSINMNRHFANPGGLHHFLAAPTEYSPFGQTPAGGSSFYATSWSLIRYTADRFGSTEPAFFGALNGAATTGAANLAARAGVSLETLLGGWALAMYADDLPGVPAAYQVPTWDFHHIYAGLRADYGAASYPQPYPLVPTSLSFGSVTPALNRPVQGGGVAYFRFTGTQSAPQLIRLTGNAGAALPGTLRLAVMRMP